MKFFLHMEKLPTVTAQQKGVRVINGKPHHYTKPEVLAERKVLCELLKEYVPEEPITGPVWMVVRWIFPTSKTHKSGEWHIQKPDGDNITKLLLDAMTEVGFFKDDKQIADLNIMKFYGPITGVSISLDEQFFPVDNDLLVVEANK